MLLKFLAFKNLLCLKEHPIDIHALDSCEYIWESGVGFAYSPPHSPQYDYHRVEILKLLLTTFSETMYLPPSSMIILILFLLL